MRISDWSSDVCSSDLWFQRNKRLMMSKQEIKDEMRQSDGAPELKQAQRQRAHEILSGSARKAVSEATVVLTNPTHRSEEHTSELQSLMSISYAVFCLKKKTKQKHYILNIMRLYTK